MSRQNEPKVGRQHVYKVPYKGSKVTVTLYITKTVNTSVFVIYRPRKFVFAIRLGSMLTHFYLLCPLPTVFCTIVVNDILYI